MHILIVDDDPETRELLGRTLARDGHSSVSVPGAREALACLETDRFDVVVLDVMLGSASGLDLCADLRERGLESPILFLSARGTVNARVDGLEAGADDYLPKPFAARELVARVRALGRRGRQPPWGRSATALTLGSLRLDFYARRAAVGEREVPVTRREWQVLQAIADADGRVVAFDAMLERVWGEATAGTRASLDVIISRLRRKLDEACGRPWLRTVRGEGYALDRTGASP